MRQVFPTWPDFIQSGFIRTSPDLCSWEADGDRCSWAVGGGVLSLRDCIRLMNCRAGWKLSMLSRAWSVSRLTREVAALIDTNTDKWLKKKDKHSVSECGHFWRKRKTNRTHRDTRCLKQLFSTFSQQTYRPAVAHRTTWKINTYIKHEE